MYSALERLSMDEKVAGFLDDLKLSNPGHYQIIIRIRAMIFQVIPDITEVIMYGGLIYKIGSPVFGLFSRQKYVTLEIEKGSGIADPYSVMEGKGARRHIVITSVADVESKKVSEYIIQRITLDKN